MTKKYDNEVRRVKYLMINKKAIKFFDDDEMYELSDSILNDDKTELKYGTVANGDTVEVGINKGFVNFIKKSDKQQEPKDDKEDNKDVKTLTVQGRPSKGFSIMFQEEEGTWHQVSPKVQSIVQGLNKDDKVEVTFGKFQAKKKDGSGTYPKDGVVFIKKTGDAPVKEEKKETKNEGSKSTYQNTTNNSIERQVALKGAIEIVKVLIEKDKVEKDKVKEAIKDLTVTCNEALNNIK